MARTQTNVTQHGPAGSSGDGSQDGSVPDGVAPGSGATAAAEVVLAVGSRYFHDGRVGPGRYESDLPPTLVAAFSGAQGLLRAVFDEVGAPADAPIAARCGRYDLHFGEAPGQAEVIRRTDAEGTAGPRDRARVAAGHWVRGVVASRDADDARAAADFEAEGDEAVVADTPQRAAIAYRAAAASAQASGRADNANRLLRLAGKAYLEIAESVDTLPQGVFMAYREGARCFLEAGNLPLAHRCLSKALAIGETLGYTEAT